MFSVILILPDTIWPPLFTTTLPVLAEWKVTSTLLASTVLIESGNITSSFSLKTATITFLELKLCWTLLKVAFINWSVTAVAWDNCKFVSPDPSPVKSPTKDPDMFPPDTNKEPVTSAEPLKGNPWFSPAFSEYDAVIAVVDCVVLYVMMWWVEK